MPRLKKYFQIVGLSALILILTLFLSGCFDIYQEIWLGSNLEKSTMRTVLTTTSKETFENLKGTLTSYMDEEEVSFETVEPDTPEGITKYKTIIKTTPEEDNLSIFPYNGGTAYEFKLFSEESQNGVDDKTESLFEDHTYQVKLHFPKPIKEAWWGKVDTDHKDYIGEELITKKDFNLEIKLPNAFIEDFAYLTIII